MTTLKNLDGVLGVLEAAAFFVTAVALLLGVATLVVDHPQVDRLQPYRTVFWATGIGGMVVGIVLLVVRAAISAVTWWIRRRARRRARSAAE